MAALSDLLGSKYFDTIWDTLTSARPYRPTWNRGNALAYLGDQAGSYFDLQVADLFNKVLGQSN